MFRDILFIVIFFGCAQYSFAQNQANPDTESNDENTHKFYEEISKQLGAISVSAKEIAENSARDESIYIDLAKDDLDAQKDMAKFTRLIYIITAIGIVISAIGLLGLYLNLRLTRVIIKQNRAWLTPKLPRNDPLEVINDIPHLKFNWENTGQSPALNVEQTYFFIAIQAIPPEQAREVRYESDEEKTTWGLIGSIGVNETTGLNIPLDKDQLKTIDDPERSLIFDVKVRYQTIHGQIGVSEALFEIQSIVDEPNKRKGFLYTPIGIHNTCT